MNVVVLASDSAKKVFMHESEAIRWIEVEDLPAAKKQENVDAYFLLDEMYMQEDLKFTQKPVFIHSVNQTLQENNQAEHVVRFNGWPGFIEKAGWEMSGIISEEVKSCMQALGKKIIQAPDTVGMISAPVIASIINEAYHAEADGVSSQSDIDIAMKLGTNYPYGPFEWAAMIGEKEVFDLLQKLSKDNPRYIPAKGLQLKAAI